jgi:hypothetical protein
MHHCGGKLHGQHANTPSHQHKAKSVLQGALELPGLDQKLDVQLPGVKLFALELAALQGAVAQQVTQLKQQSAEELDKVCWCLDGLMLMCWFFVGVMVCWIQIECLSVAAWTICTVMLMALCLLSKVPPSLHFT